MSALKAPESAAGVILPSRCPAEPQQGSYHFLNRIFGRFTRRVAVPLVRVRRGYMSRPIAPVRSIPHPT